MPTLDELIAWARTVKMTPEQQAQQRLSFVYGNCKIGNDLITREMVEDVDKKLRRNDL